jgi:integrase
LSFQEPRTPWIRRNWHAELGRFLFNAERFDHGHAALAVLFGLNGLRVSEARETNIEDMAFERGHRVRRIIGKGNKPALIGPPSVEQS